MASSKKRHCYSIVILFYFDVSLWSSEGNTHPSISWLQVFLASCFLLDNLVPTFGVGALVSTENTITLLCCFSILSCNDRSVMIIPDGKKSICLLWVVKKHQSIDWLVQVWHSYTFRIITLTLFQDRTTTRRRITTATNIIDCLSDNGDNLFIIDIPSCVVIGLRQQEKKHSRLSWIIFVDHDAAVLSNLS